MEELCVKVIDEVKGAEDAHTHYHTDDGTSDSDFMSTAAAALTTPLHLTSVKIARREIKVWKSRTLPLPKTSLVILSGNGVVVSRSFHGLLFWPGVCWRFLTHPPHLSAFCLSVVTPSPRNGAVCHVIILRNACIYMRPGLKSVSGPQTKRSSTWISSSLWPLFVSLTFSLRRGVLL